MVGNYIALTKPFDIKDVLFGNITQELFNKLVKYIMLESQYVLYSCKLHNKPISLKSLLVKIKRTYQIEHFLARQKDLRKKKMGASSSCYITLDFSYRLHPDKFISYLSYVC